MQRPDQSLIDTIGRRLRLPDEARVSLAVDRNHQELDDACPHCGQATLVCMHADLGGPTLFDDLFGHVCVNAECDYILGPVRHRSEVGQECADDQLCPFCGRDVVGFLDERRPAERHTSGVESSSLQAGPP